MPEIIQGGTHGVSVMPVPSYNGSNDNSRSVKLGNIHVDARASNLSEDRVRQLAYEGQQRAIAEAAPSLIGASVQSIETRVRNRGGRL